jgi:hypothetical protein
MDIYTSQDIDLHELVDGGAELSPCDGSVGGRVYMYVYLYVGTYVPCLPYSR